MFIGENSQEIVIPCVSLSADEDYITISVDGVPVEYPQYTWIDENGQEHHIMIQIPEGDPIVDENGLLLIDMSAIERIFKAETEWDAKAKTVHIRKDASVAKITIGDNKIYLNDTEIITDTVARNLGARIYIHICDIAHGFDFELDWDDATKNLNLTYVKSREAGQ